MKYKGIDNEERLQKKFEVSTAHLSKCFGMIAKTFAGIYTGEAPSSEDLKCVERLERSARFFSRGEKGQPFYKVPCFFHFIRSRLREARSLNLDFAAFKESCMCEWRRLTQVEKRAFAKHSERFQRIRRKVNGFELFSDPEGAERRNKQ